MTQPSNASVGAKDTSWDSSGSHGCIAISTGHVFMLDSTLGNYTQNVSISCLIAQAQTFAPPPRNSYNLPYLPYYRQLSPSPAQAQTSASPERTQQAQQRRHAGNTREASVSPLVSYSLLGCETSPQKRKAMPTQGLFCWLNRKIHFVQ